MAAGMTVTAVLNKFFNTADSPAGYEKRPIGVFRDELKALTDGEKRELATLAAAEMGVTLA